MCLGLAQLRRLKVAYKQLMITNWIVKRKLLYLQNQYHLLSAIARTEFMKDVCEFAHCFLKGKNELEAQFR